MTWLVADVSGNSARFGLVERPGAVPSRVQMLLCREHAGLSAAAATYLARYAGHPRPSVACIAVAGLTDGEHFRVAEPGWAGTATRLREDLRLERLELIDGLLALVLALPHLGPGDWRAIGGARPRAGLPMAVLNPGTGLGVAGLVPGCQAWVPISTEAGHLDLSAATPKEAEVLRLLRAEHNATSAHSLMCANGLTRLHGLLARLHGLPADPRTPAQICARRGDPLCTETLKIFCALLGSFAGNVALSLGARGGVYLGGDILPRIGDVLRRSDLRRRFEAKPPMEDYLKAIATVLITAPAPALTGAAVWLGQRLVAEQAGRQRAGVHADQRLGRQSLR